MKKSGSFFTSVLMFAIPVMAFFVFNVLTPVWWDDFVMACFFTKWGDPHTTLLSSFSDVLVSTRNIYQTHHGRSVADFLNFLFMFFKNKTIFNVCNTAVYCAFVLLMGFHITGSLKKVSGPLFVMLNVLLWLVLDAYGQDLLWLTGSCNYLWTGTVILLFLVPFRKRADNPSYKPHILIAVLWAVVGILSGWSMENSASAVFVLLAAYFIQKGRKRESVSVFEILGALGFLAGFFMLISARHNLFPGFLGLLKNTIKVGVSFIIKDSLLLGVIVLLAVELFVFRKEKISKTAAAYFIAALGSVAAMVLPGVFGGRSDFMTQVFLVITLVSLVLQFAPLVPKRYTVMIYTAVLCMFIPSFYSGGKSMVSGFLYDKAREHYILTEKQNGRLNIAVKTPIPVSDPHSGMYGAIDVDDPSNPAYMIYNSAKVTWYGIDSLDGIFTLKGAGGAKRNTEGMAAALEKGETGYRRTAGNAL